MEERRSRAAVFKPLLTVFFVALGSYLVYYGSRLIGYQPLHQALAASFGAIYFVSIFFGALYIYSYGYVRGVSLPVRILASGLVPFLWMTKDVLVMTESHPIVECLYWYFNPLSVWMVCLLAIEMGAGTLLSRAILKRRGEEIKVLTPGPFASILIGALLFGGIFAWGQGENLFSLYLDGYRLLFGSGI